MTHTAFKTGGTAVITGAASGIGLAASKRLAANGMNVCMTDITEDALQSAAEDVRAEAADSAQILAEALDVSDLDAMTVFSTTVGERFGKVAFLMNNAVTRIDAGTWEDAAAWTRTIAVNIMGVVNGAQAFAPAMISANETSVIVNVGSKQGITNPPGNKPAYNMAKAAVINYTESLQHELRNTPDCRTSAHLLIPGWTTTGTKAHQPGAWLPDQVVEYMLAAIDSESFYILCPDDEVDSAEDRRRVLWSAGDISENRPPLSRWHPDFGDDFQQFSGDLT